MLCIVNFRKKIEVALSFASGMVTNDSTSRPEWRPPARPRQRLDCQRLLRKSGLHKEMAGSIQWGDVTHWLTGWQVQPLRARGKKDCR